MSNRRLNSSVSTTMIEAYSDLDANVEGDTALEKFVAAFQDTIIDDHFKPCKYYIRSLAFVQSSGSGKSRLLRNAGLYIPSFQVILRGQGLKNTSVPRPDDVVCDYFRTLDASEKGEHVAAAFMSALFHQLYIIIAHGYDPNLSLGPETYSTDPEVVHQLYMENKRMAKTSMIEKASTKDFVNGILLPLYSLRPLSGNKAREDFLSRVITLTKAILARTKKLLVEYEEDDQGRNGSREKHHVDWRFSSLKRYILASNLKSNVDDLFELIDGTSDGSTFQAFGTKANQHHQFIFGLDDCRYLEENFAKMITKARSHFSEGLLPFIRVMRDLELLSHGFSSKPDNPSRRVWLGMVDSASNARELVRFQRLNRGAYCPDGYVQSNYIGATIWTHFGTDHALVRAKGLLGRENCIYYHGMTLEQLHHFGHLKMMGRGSWNTIKDPMELVTLAMEKVLNGFEACESKCLFKKDHRPWSDSGPIDQIIFSIASFRLNLDGDMLCYPPGNEVRDVTEAVDKHMRTLIHLQVEHAMETATPSEPILAVAALLLLNYGRGILESEKSLLSIERNDVSWMRFLSELTRCLIREPNLVKLGSKGELAGRIILTRARDCTLPRYWNLSMHPMVPVTTVETFLEKLVGKDKGRSILEKANDAAFSQALINFTHFTSVSSLLDEGVKEKASGLIEANELCKAFTRCAAFYCPPNQVMTSGLTALLPILVPKVLRCEMIGNNLDNTAHVDHNSLFDDYHIDYIGIIERVAKEPYTEDLVAIPFALNGEILKQQPIAIILMDMGPIEAFTDHDRISDDIMIRAAFPQSGNQPMHQISIRGITGAYPNLADVAETEIVEGFEKSVYRKMKMIEPISAIARNGAYAYREDDDTIPEEIHESVRKIRAMRKGSLI